MCLLDRVEDFDEQRICCRAHSHRAAGNPLRAHGRLGAACGIEYAAQAMAVHGALLAPTVDTMGTKNTPARAGYLVSLRDTRLYVSRLDDIAADLTIEAVCVTRNSNHILYQFSVRAESCLLLEGRAAVVLDAGLPAIPTGDTR